MAEEKELRGLIEGQAAECTARNIELANAAIADLSERGQGAAQTAQNIQMANQAAAAVRPPPESK